MSVGDDPSAVQNNTSEDDPDNAYYDPYYAFDDDFNRDPYQRDESEKRNPLKPESDGAHRTNIAQCRRVNWYRDLPINCNTIHELIDSFTLARQNQHRFLGEGAYRTAFETKRTVPGPTNNTAGGSSSSSNNKNMEETICFKKYVWDKDNANSTYNKEDYEYMRMDAIVNERIGSYPHIVNIYGFCALSIVSEFMPYGDIDLVAAPGGWRGENNDPSRGTGYKPLELSHNDLTPTQKLQHALDMVEAVSLLHSYEGGVMVHGDIQTSQFLLDKDGRVLLNDFNRAEIMTWDEDGDHDYCRYTNGHGGGDWRAPEEYLDEPLNEKVDIFSLGNNFYTLLTGESPFYDTYTYDEVEKKVTDPEGKEKPFIDPRFQNSSVAEKALANVIPRMWIYEPDDRIDAFEIIKLLREAKRLQEKAEQQ